MKTMNFFSKFFGKNEKNRNVKAEETLSEMMSLYKKDIHLDSSSMQYYSTEELKNYLFSSKNGETDILIKEMIAAKNRNEEVVNDMIMKADQFEKSMKK